MACCLDARKELGAGATDAAVANLAFQRLAIAFGKKILAIVPGRVSTEVDARLSYDTQATIAQARSIIAQYDAGRHRPRAHPHQDRLHLGGHPRRRSAGAGRHPLQPHAALRTAPGHRLRRGRRHAHLALRGPHPRLVQERHRQGFPRRRRSRRELGDHGLQLLQELRLQDGGHGRQLSQHWRDYRAGRLRPAHHLAATAGRARSHPGRACRASSRPKPPNPCTSKGSPWTRTSSRSCTPPTAWRTTS